MEPFPIAQEIREEALEQLALASLKPGDVILLDTPYRDVRLEVIGAEDGQSPTVRYIEAKKNESKAETFIWPAEGRTMMLRGLCPRIAVVQGQMRLLEPNTDMIAVGNHAWLERIESAANDTDFVTGPISEIIYQQS